MLTKGNGHQVSNRRKALEFVRDNLNGAHVVDERTVKLEPFGECHFMAFADKEGAMISTPGRNDNEFGSADWHRRNRVVMFRDFGDGRCMVYVCPIEPLFGKRTIGKHGVRWADIDELADLKKVWPKDEVSKWNASRSA